MKAGDQRRWGEKLRKEIEEAGGIEAWQRKKTRGDRPTGARRPHKEVPVPRSAPAAHDHPLEGSLLTKRGVWAVSVLKDENVKGMRVFKLSLDPPKTQTGKPVAFVVRVPLEVIREQRPRTWAADLRAALTSWINTNAVTNRERIWSPPAE